MYWTGLFPTWQSRSSLAFEKSSDRLELVQSIESALKAFRDLRNGVKPDYNDNWIALFYLLWYQPKQINLAYSLIQEAFKQDPSKDIFSKPSGNLHVVDFGCGALAMQFAVVLAAMNAIEQGSAIPEIRVDSIDPNSSMVKLGGVVKSSH